MQQGSNIHSTLLDFAEENNIDIVIVGESFNFASAHLDLHMLDSS